MGKNPHGLAFGLALLLLAFGFGLGRCAFDTSLRAYSVRTGGNYLEEKQR